MFGMPMGPFRLADLVGMEVGVHVGKNFIKTSGTLVSIAIDSCFSMRSAWARKQKWILPYDDRRKASPDMDAIAPSLKMLEKIAKYRYAGPPGTTRLFRTGYRRNDFSSRQRGTQSVGRRHCGESGGCGCRFSARYGFPPKFRGGILHRADQIGIRKFMPD